MNPDLTWLAELVGTWGYPVIGLVAIPEGPLIMVLSGFLVQLGILAFWPAYIALIIGDFIADVLWYKAGYGLTKLDVVQKYAKKGVDMDRLERIGRAFHTHQTLVLVLSKLTCGFGVLAIPIIVAAGAYRIPFRRFLLIYGGAGFVWTLIPMGVGYYMGDWYLSAGTWLGRVALIGMLVAVGVGSFYFLWPMFGQLVGKKVVPPNNPRR